MNLPPASFKFPSSTSWDSLSTMICNLYRWSSLAVSSAAISALSSLVVPAISSFPRLMFSVMTKSFEDKHLFETHFIAPTHWSGWTVLYKRSYPMALSAAGLSFSVRLKKTTTLDLIHRPSTFRFLTTAASDYLHLMLRHASISVGLSAKVVCVVRSVT